MSIAEKALKNLALSLFYGDNLKSFLGTKNSYPLAPKNN
jgi:hypothetical protein